MARELEMGRGVEAMETRRRKRRAQRESVEMIMINPPLLEVGTGVRPPKKT